MQRRSVTTSFDEWLTRTTSQVPQSSIIRAYEDSSSSKRMTTLTAATMLAMPTTVEKSFLMSTNSGVDHNHQVIESTLRKVNETKFDEELHKTKERKYEKVRIDARPPRVQQESEDSKKHEMSSSKKLKQLPISINIGVDYNPQVFENTLRQAFETKFDEELHKIKERTDEMVRSEIRATRFQQEFEDRRKHEMSSFKKRIPKQAIIHRIEKIHRAKFPSFSISKCLTKKIHKNLPDSASRQEIQEFEEKKIDADITRKSSLVRQQELIKHGLTIESKKMLGLIPSIPLLNEQEIDEELNSEDLNHTTSPGKPSEQSNTQEAQQNASPNDKPASAHVKRGQMPNRHIHPCNMSFHDDEFLERKFYMSMRSSSAVSPTSRSFGEYQSLSALGKKNSLASTVYSMNMNHRTSSFSPVKCRRAESSFQQASSSFTESSPIHTRTSSSNIYSNQQVIKLAPTGSAQSSGPPRIGSQANNQQNLKEIAAAEKQRKKREMRQNSPLNFLFNRYAQLVQSNDVQTHAMKKLTHIYITNPQSEDSPRKSLHHLQSTESSPINQSGIQFYQPQGKRKLQSQNNSVERRPKDTQPSSKNSPQKLPSTSYTSHHKELLETLLDFKRESDLIKSVTKKYNVSSRTSPDPKRPSSTNPSNSANYDNLQGMYNVSDFMKKIQDERQAQIDKELKAQKLVKKTQISKAGSPTKHSVPQVR